MQKLIIMTLLAAAIFPACKKDKGPVTPTAPKPANTVNEPGPVSKVNELIKGTWVVTQQRYEYFNDANALLFEEIVPTTPNDRYEYKIDDRITSTNVTTTSVEELNTDYVITQKLGKDHVSFKVKYDENRDFEIVALTDQTMEWKRVIAEPMIDYIENGMEKEAAKKVITLTFKKDNTK